MTEKLAVGSQVRVYFQLSFHTTSTITTNEMNPPKHRAPLGATRKSKGSYRNFGFFLKLEIVAIRNTEILISLSPTLSAIIKDLNDKSLSPLSFQAVAFVRTTIKQQVHDIVEQWIREEMGLDKDTKLQVHVEDIQVTVKR